MSLSEASLQLWARMICSLIIAVTVVMAVFALICAWLDKREQKRRATEELKERVLWLEKGNYELRETINEKDDEIFEHLEANANLATERDRLNVLLEVSQSEVCMWKKAAESKRERLAQKLSDLLHLVKSEY